MFSKNTIVRKEGPSFLCGNAAWLVIAINLTWINSTVYSNSWPASVPTPARLCHLDNRNGWVSVSGFAHLLLFYRFQVTDLPVFGSGESMLKALTDEATAINVFGNSPFVRTRSGLRYLLLKKDPLVNAVVGEAHRDQCLATFADLNLPLNTPISLKSGDYRILDLLRESLSTFYIDEAEPAWTALAYTKYLPPNNSWTNRFGERFTFSDIAKHLTRIDLTSQSCGGTHVLEALIRLDNADIRFHVLDENARKMVHSYLRIELSKIINQQHPDGSWSSNWDSGVDNNSPAAPEFRTQLLITGHLLQMLLELDSNLSPRGSVYLRAARWITAALNSPRANASDVSLLCPFTHAALSAKETFKQRRL